MEDIDCAFPSREDLEEADSYMYSTPGKSLYVPGGVHNPKRSNVTLSGLLNVVDGVGSEEGKLFFATVSSSDFHCVRRTNILSTRQTTSIVWILHLCVLDEST